MCKIYFFHLTDHYVRCESLYKHIIFQTEEKEACNTLYKLTFTLGVDECVQ